MNALRPWHIILVVAVLVLLFGAKKLPDAARSLGRSMRILKAETKGLTEDGKSDIAEKADAQVTSQKPLSDDEPSPSPNSDRLKQN